MRRLFKKFPAGEDVFDRTAVEMLSDEILSFDKLFFRPLDKSFICGGTYTYE